MHDRIKVLIVDDSAVVRGFISKILRQIPVIDIVSTAFNGEVGVRHFEKYKPDVVIMDIEMPVMDGLEALQKIMQIDRNAKVVICSTLSTKQADVTIKAMTIGAADCLAKPEAKSEINTSQNFKEALLRVVLSLGGMGGGQASAMLKKGLEDSEDNQKSGADTAKIETPVNSKTSKADIEQAAQLRKDNAQTSVPAPKISDNVTLRPFPSAHKKPDVLAIGSSTGGPQALFAVLKHLKDSISNIPVIITQHMPPTFTEMLAKHITSQTGIEAVEGQNDMPLKPGRVHIAPGGYHMLFEGSPNSVEIRLSDAPPENFCRPAVDPMIRSILAIYPKSVLGVILTGMGQDGLRGMAQLVENNNILLAQDEASSIVWGMPGAVAKAGLCHSVLPINEIGPKVASLLSKD